MHLLVLIQDFLHLTKLTLLKFFTLGHLISAFTEVNKMFAILLCIFNIRSKTMIIKIIHLLGCCFSFIYIRRRYPARIIGFFLACLILLIFLLIYITICHRLSTIEVLTTFVHVLIGLLHSVKLTLFKVLAVLKILTCLIAEVDSLLEFAHVLLTLLILLSVLTGLLHG